MNDEDLERQRIKQDMVAQLRTAPQAEMREIAEAVDPNGVMKLAGGYKVYN